MHCTLWSRDTLLGELEVIAQSDRPRILTGPFRPTDAARDVLPLFLDAKAAVMAIGPMLERRGITSKRLGAEVGRAVHDALLDSPEGRRVNETRATLDALALEIHDAAGSPVPTGLVMIHEAWSAEVAAIVFDGVTSLSMNEDP